MRKYNHSQNWNLAHEKRKEEINEFISTYWMKNFVSPNMRDIAAAFNTSTSYVSWILEKLDEDGKVMFSKKRSRHIVPVWVPIALERWWGE